MIKLCLILFGFFLLCSQANIHLNYVMDGGINNRTITTLNGSKESKDEKYFEDFLDLKSYYKNFQVAAKFSRYNPVRSFSFSKSGTGLYHRYIEYNQYGVSARLGSYYSIFGRGLVLSSYEDKNLGFDSKIDGGKLEYQSDFVDFKVLGGTIQNPERDQKNNLLATELKIKPLDELIIGANIVKSDFLYSRFQNINIEQWGSFFGEINLPFLSFYSEYAYTKDYSGQKALYSALTLFYEESSLLLEFKNYDKYRRGFRGKGKLVYNNAPTLVQQDRFALWQRHSYFLNMDDEIGYAVKFDQWLSDNILLSLVNTVTETHKKLRMYKESSAQFEWTDFYFDELIGILGKQEDILKIYRNAGITVSKLFGKSKYSISMEYQRVENKLSPGNGENQNLILEYSYGSDFSLALFGERSTEKDRKRDYWFGLKASTNYFEDLNAYIFAGNRRKGKVCAGGVCILSPEFSGVEFGLNYRFSTSF